MAQLDERYHVRAVARAISIMSVLSDGRPHSLTEFSQTANINRSTAFRLLATLACYNYVERDPHTGDYRLGLACLELARAYHESNVLHRMALPYLEQLRDQTTETVHLAVLDHMEVVYIEKLPGLHAIGLMSSRVGGRSPSHCTGVGKALLAHLPPRIVQEHFERTGLRRYTEATIADVGGLMCHLEQIRHQGYALDLGEHEAEVRCVAAAIFEGSGKVAASVSVSGPAGRLEPLEQNATLIERDRQALVKTAPGPGHLELKDMARPENGPDEVLIRVRACGICGSDLKIQDDKHPVTPPVIIGHEFAGEIAQTGSHVSGWAVGDRVVSEQHVGACGRCRQCLTGSAFACASKRAPGYFTDGAFTEFIKVPAWLLHRIPPGLSFIEAAFTEPSAVAAHGVLDRTGIEPGSVVLVLGCGPIGLVAARMAQAAGASKVIITGIEADEQARLPKARELGIDHVINVTHSNLEEVVARLIGGEGADVVIELSGALPAIQQSFRLARRLGKIGIIGQPPADEVSIPYREALFRALTVSFSYSSKYTSWERTLDLFERRVINPAQFITHVLPLAEWERGFALARSGEAVKVVLEIC